MTFPEIIKDYNLANRIDVMQFCRRPFVGNYSVERTIGDIRANLPLDIHTAVRVNKYFSKGIVKRLIDAAIAVRYQRHVNHVASDIHYITLFLNQKRTILTINDCISLEKSKGIKHWILWYFWYWLPIKKSAIVVAISEETKKQVVRYTKCDPSKVRVIYCNVSDEFSSVPKEFNKKSPRILHIGTGDNKNLERHVESIIEINCRFVVIGHLSKSHQLLLDQSGIEYENLKDLTREEILEQYILCDLLLFASLYEGFGLPIVEAQTVGRPVITSNLSSMPEIAGDGALMVDPYNIESIKSGIQEIIESEELRQNLVQNGYDNCKRFSAKHMGLEFGKVYREVYNSNS